MWRHDLFMNSTEKKSELSTGRGGIHKICHSSIHFWCFHASSSRMLITLLLASWLLNFGHFRGLMKIWFAVTYTYTVNIYRLQRKPLHPLSWAVIIWNPSSKSKQVMLFLKSSCLQEKERETFVTVYENSEPQILENRIGKDWPFWLCGETCEI